MSQFKLHEMALRAGNLTASANAWAKQLETYVTSHIEEHKSIGMIDGLNVRRHLFTITIWNGEEMIMAARIDKIPNSYCSVDDVWVKESWRGKKMFVKFLLFLKNELGYSQLALAEVHSDDTYNLLRAGGLKLFKKHWQNRLGDSQPFSVDTIDQFYGPGKWKLILENTEDLTSLIKENSFTHSYQSLAQLADLTDVV